jgi:cobaltochelatase CobN
MFHLLGVEAIWEKNGRVNDFSIIPLEKLGRPRIDLAVRVSGITRDNFPSTIELLDRAITEVAALDEDIELNFVRRHALEQLRGKSPEDSEAWRQATFRVFASKPGTYQAGTQLAVLASAWETEKDLASVFLYWNGYAYGQGAFGVPAHQSLVDSLGHVEVTVDKTVTDEYDLTGCCGYYGTHGGLINAAKNISGREIRNYYGDTRRQGQVSLRTLNEEVRRVARGKILNPIWIEGLKKHGYRGASEISKRVGHLYGWQATAKVVDGEIFDDVARTFLMNKDNRDFFEKENPWALEEMARRLLEAARRDLWRPAADVLKVLESFYLEIEGWLEERGGDVPGEFQGGQVKVDSLDDLTSWAKEFKKYLKEDVK